MNQARPAGPRSLIVKALGLLAALALSWWSAAAPLHASTCFLGENLVIVYYSSAAHTQIVGTCSMGPCPGAGCVGMKTSFATGHSGGICEVCR